MNTLEDCEALWKMLAGTLDFYKIELKIVKYLLNFIDHHKQPSNVNDRSRYHASITERRIQRSCWILMNVIQKNASHCREIIRLGGVLCFESLIIELTNPNKSDNNTETIMFCIHALIGIANDDSDDDSRAYNSKQKLGIIAFFVTLSKRLAVLTTIIRDASTERSTFSHEFKCDGDRYRCYKCQGMIFKCVRLWLTKDLALWNKDDRDYDAIANNINFNVNNQSSIVRNYIADWMVEIITELLIQWTYFSMIKKSLALNKYMMTVFINGLVILEEAVNQLNDRMNIDCKDFNDQIKNDDEHEIEQKMTSLVAVLIAILMAGGTWYQLKIAHAIENEKNEKDKNEQKSKSRSVDHDHDHDPTCLLINKLLTLTISTIDNIFGITYNNYQTCVSVFLCARWVKWANNFSINISQNNCMFSKKCKLLIIDKFICKIFSNLIYIAWKDAIEYIVENGKDVIRLFKQHALKPILRSHHNGKCNQSKTGNGNERYVYRDNSDKSIDHRNVYSDKPITDQDVMNGLHYFCSGSICELIIALKKSVKHLYLLSSMTQDSKYQIMKIVFQCICVNWRHVSDKRICDMILSGLQALLILLKNDDGIESFAINADDTSFRRDGTRVWDNNNMYKTHFVSLFEMSTAETVLECTGQRKNDEIKHAMQQVLYYHESLTQCKWFIPEKQVGIDVHIRNCSFLCDTNYRCHFVVLDGLFHFERMLSLYNFANINLDWSIIGANRYKLLKTNIHHGTFENMFLFMLKFLEILIQLLAWYKKLTCTTSINDNCQILKSLIDKALFTLYNGVCKDYITFKDETMSYIWNIIGKYYLYCQYNGKKSEMYLNKSYECYTKGHMDKLKYASSCFDRTFGMCRRDFDLFKDLFWLHCIMGNKQKCKEYSDKILQHYIFQNESIVLYDMREEDCLNIQENFDVYTNPAKVRQYFSLKHSKRKRLAIKNMTSDINKIDPRQNCRIDGHVAKLSQLIVKPLFKDMNTKQQSNLLCEIMKPQNITIIGNVLMIKQCNWEYCRRKSVKLKRCKKCRSVYYCSKLCQKKDWQLCTYGNAKKSHKFVCERLRQRSYSMTIKPI